MLILQRPDTLRPDADRLRGLAIAVAISVPLWALVIGLAKAIG